MTAPVAIKEANGAGPTLTTITQGRYCTEDAYNPGDSNPCVVPSADFNYSYWKHHALDISGAFTKINNIRWFTSGNIAANWVLGTGGMLLVAVRDADDNGCPSGDYDQSTGVEGETGKYIKDAADGHAYYKAQTANPADADGYTSAASLTVDTSDYTVPAVSKYVVTQTKIGSDATQGDKPNETLTMRYDEI